MLFLVRTLAAAGSGPPSRAGRGDGSWRSAVTVGTNWGTPAVTVAALAFMLSPYVLQYEARISALLMPWAALPWLVALVVRALRVGGWRYPAIFALVTAITGAVNRFRAWVIPDEVGTVQVASQHPKRDNAPVTFVATSS